MFSHSVIYIRQSTCVNCVELANVVANYEWQTILNKMWSLEDITLF